ncbi:hypothetical protein BDE02_15G095000 [Populus trichocarpa]|nr:hypothetical protein BDE02_15G095000 [Populus trichocarpa]KAI5563106.1 hypothetical protein BDE02_15G095000 [Populus trichocarpa]KAI5563107.1 hypothetical protein BDE02_15G095000 [Populus trichocarpa]
MVHSFRACLLLFAILILASNLSYTRASMKGGNKIKSATFLSPKFVLGPGSVENRFYRNVDFPKGHIGIKSFNAEVIDDTGNPVPLHETYLHHWLVSRYYQRLDVVETNHEQKFKESDRISARNSGICQKGILNQYFGLGSETRKTATHIPDPYAIEIGNPAEIPVGYEERWLLNVHAIDTRGAEDRLGCTECRCDLYNITVSEWGRPLRPDYKGGLLCCYDHTQCKVKQGFQGTRRSLYLRYTVEWVEWDSDIIPVKIFIFDVTDTGKRLNGSTGFGPENGCQVEYEIKSCSSTDTAVNGCVDVKRTNFTMPTTGYLIYGVAHQHTGGIGSTLYGKDGRVICTSLPTYGEGKEAGNEAGYIVGMSTCYPEPGSIQITAGEKLVLESNYSRDQNHTGVMGLFYILVADRTPNPTSLLQAPIHMHVNMKGSTYAVAIIALFGMAIAVAVTVHSRLKKGREEGYQPMLA